MQWICETFHFNHLPFFAYAPIVKLSIHINALGSVKRSSSAICFMWGQTPVQPPDRGSNFPLNWATIPSASNKIPRDTFKTRKGTTPEGVKAYFTPRCTTNRHSGCGELGTDSRPPALHGGDEWLEFTLYHDGAEPRLPTLYGALQFITQKTERPLGNLNTLKRKVVVSALGGSALLLLLSHE